MADTCTTLGQTFALFGSPAQGGEEARAMMKPWQRASQGSTAGQGLTLTPGPTPKWVTKERTDFNFVHLCVCLLALFLFILPSY